MKHKHKYRPIHISLTKSYDTESLFFLNKHVQGFTRRSTSKVLKFMLRRFFATIATNGFDAINTVNGKFNLLRVMRIDSSIFVDARRRCEKSIKIFCDNLCLAEQQPGAGISARSNDLARGRRCRHWSPSH